ncbi:HNH endonuclease [Comamonas sp. BIGb0124]|nr:HNH endonuclease [Comamonas sp. BIGb0124]
MDFWLVSKSTKRSIQPENNIHQSTMWSFGGEGQPIVICIWWVNLKRSSDVVYRRGSIKADVDMWSAMAEEVRARGEKENLLTRRMKKSQAMGRRLFEANKQRLPVRVVLLHGKIPPIEESATESAVASKRRLDHEKWWVHEYDAETGNYLLVRGVQMPTFVPKDPYAGEPDTVDDPLIAQIENSNLSETEKDALIKQRVGQGWFRDQLIARWGSCTVTGCKDMSLLIASHIKPWRLCTTRADRLSPDNGLLLSPNFDKVFDRGLISFTDNFKILFHPSFKGADRLALKIEPTSDFAVASRRRELEGLKPYLRWHRLHYGFDEA